MSLNDKFGRGGVSVRKVVLPEVPDKNMLQKLLSDLSLAAPGTECELSWQSGDHNFFLALSHSRENARANWKLYFGKGLQPRLIWEYSTNDVAILHQLVLAELQKQVRASQSMNAIPAVRGTAAPPEERRAVNIDNKLSNKLRKLFIDSQQDLITEKNSILPTGKTQDNKTKAIEYIDLTPGRELLKKFFVNQLGIFSLATFLFLLEREFYEGVENKSPITLVIFTAKFQSANSTSDVTKPLPSSLVQAIAKTIQYTQRKTDILAQMEENKFAVLLPDTNTMGGKSFVSRVQKALTKMANTAAGQTLPKFTFGMATIGEHCKILPELLYLAEKSNSVAEQLQKNLVCDQDILSEPVNDKQVYLEKAIDLKPTRQLVSQLVSAGIFTYPAFLGFLEHEFYRCARKKNDLLVIVIKMRIRAETFDQPSHLLPDQAFYEVIRRIGTSLSKRDIFAHYSHGNFVVMRSNASIVQMQNLVERIMQSVKINQWLTPECSIDSLKTQIQICAVRPHNTSSTLFGFIPVG